MRGLTALLLFALSGCFRYVPVNNQPLRQGESVRVELAVPGDYRLSQVSVNDVILVEGELIQMAPDTLAVSAWWVRARSGFEYPGAGETLRIPRGDIEALGKKRIAPAQTLGLVGAVAGTLTLLIAALDLPGISGDRGPKPGPGQ